MRNELIAAVVILLICVAFGALHHIRRSQMSARERAAEDEDIDRNLPLW